MSLGTTIRDARKAKGLTQQVVAAKLKVSVQAVSQWETDKTIPTAMNLIDLSKVIDFDLKGEIPVKAILDLAPPWLTRQSVTAPMIGWERSAWQRYLDAEEEVSDSRFEANTYLDVHWTPVGSLYSLRVTGEQAFSPAFETGDVIIVDTGRAPEKGDYVVAEVERLDVLVLGIFIPRGSDSNRAPMFDLGFGEERLPVPMKITAQNPGGVVGVVREHRRFYRTEPPSGASSNWK